MTTPPVNAHDYLLPIWQHPKCQAMFVNFALRYGFDIADVAQDGYIAGYTAILRYRQLKGDDQTLPSGRYLVKSMQHGFYSQLREHSIHNGGVLYCSSLDDPLREDNGDESYSGELSAPDQILATPDDSRAIQREQAVYDALRRMHPEEQEYICEQFHLEAFTVKPYPPTKRRREAISTNAYRTLRKDARLRELVQA